MMSFKNLEHESDNGYFSLQQNYAPTRGAYAKDSDPLCPLKNIGGIIMTDDMFQTKFGHNAKTLLGMSPFPSQEMIIENDDPDFQHYRSHLQALKDCNVLVPVTREQVTGVGKYMAVLKDDVHARAIFDLRYTNFIHVLKESPLLFLVRNSSFNSYCILGIALKGGSVSFTGILRTGTTRSLFQRN